MESLPLICLDRVDSTQAFLRRHPELWPCAVLASAQSEGRGRADNRWESAAGAGLWFSAALTKPKVSPGLLLQRAMLAVIEALEPCGLELGLKWPNDLVAWQAGSLVKVGGIIGEMSGDTAILGVGINLGEAPVMPERAIPPASLRALGAQRLPDPRELAREILHLWGELELHREPAFWWPVAGMPIRWEAGEGVCEGWLEDGRLAVRMPQGRQELCVGDLSGLGQT